VVQTLDKKTGLKSKRAFEKQAEILTEDDLEAITKSCKEFRKNFAFRPLSS
jgi:hypothetical protein